MKLLKLLLTLTVLILATVTGSTFKIDSTGELEEYIPDSSNIYHFWSSKKVMIPKVYTEKSEEFRGVWVATVYNLNMPQHTSESQYKAAFEDLIDEVLAANMNAIIFQVRSNNDAFYDSAYAPFSRWLTGTEGVDPGWDVMQYMIDYSHANGIEFHAWLNPYRVANSTSSEENMLNTLHTENWAKQNPDMVIAGDMDSHNRYPYILNPGEPDVKTYIRDVVTVLITLYNVDGIHFDDYFYPYSGISSDTTTYDTYKEVGQTIKDWRRENVNDVVRGVKEDIDAYNTTNTTDIRFGISPFGLWGSGIEGYPTTLEGGSNTGPTNLSTYHSQYADSKKWVEEGWIHYICPQVYFQFTHNTAPYADVVDWWASVVRGTDVDLIIGQAISKAETDNWNVNEISDQLLYNQQHPEIDGTAMYSAAFLDKEDLALAVSNYWTTTPTNTWASSSVASPDISLSGTLDGNVYRSNVTATLTSSDTIYYRIDGGDWTLYTTPLDFISNGTYTLHMKAVDGSSIESMITGINITITKINFDVPNISIIGDMVGESYVLDSKIAITATEDIYVKINHGSLGAWVLYTGEITLDDPGLYVVYSKTINSEGIESAESSLFIDIASACYDDPVISVLGNSVAGVYAGATVSATADSPTIYYKIDNSAWAIYTGSISFIESGTYTVSFKNDDTCGVVVSETLTIDATAPNVPNIVITGDMTDGVYTDVSTFTLTTEDTTAILKYRMKIDDAWSSWLTFFNDVIIASSGTITIEYAAIDSLGNVSEIGSTEIEVNISQGENNMYVIRDGELVHYYETNIPVTLPTEYVENTEEIRAIWIATVSNIDIGVHYSEADYKAKIISMLNTIEENNFNTIFFQVRPLNDAFYESSYAPFSRFLTGVEGVDPGWDVLGFLIEESHKRGIEFHAWLNPYRVSSGSGTKEQQLSVLADNNFAKMHPDLVIMDNLGHLLLNPGELQVQSYIKNVILELITKYDVDGIHFDDYFYSYAGMSNSEDEELYNNYKDIGESLGDWRRSNIDTIVEDIYISIENYNTNNDETVKFGISPFGIWMSGGDEGSNTSLIALESYSDQYADTKKWVEEGWLHYILPQLYWGFDDNLAPFADLVDWWADLCEENDVDLLIGHGFYRYIDGGFADEDEILEQLRYISQYDIVKGSAFFSYRSINSWDAEVQAAMQRLNDYYWTEYASFPWESDVVKADIPEDPICTVDQTLEDGVCVDIPPVCGFNQTLVDGACVDDPVVCLDGYEEIDGECTLIEDSPKEKKTGCFSQVNIGDSLVFTITVLSGGLFLLLKRKSSN